MNKTFNSNDPGKKMKSFFKERIIITIVKNILVSFSFMLIVPVFK